MSFVEMLFEGSKVNVIGIDIEREMTSNPQTA